MAPRQTQGESLLQLTASIARVVYLLTCLSLSSILLSLYCPTIFAAAANGEGVQTFSYPNHGFSISLPKGWIEIPPDKLQEATTAVHKFAPGAPVETYEHGYQLDSAAHWLEYPYILVQVRSGGRVPASELEKIEKEATLSDKDSREVEQGFNGLISNMQMGRRVYDPETHTIWTKVSTISNNRTIQAINAMYLTERGWISLWCYALSGQDQQYLPMFTETIKSVQLTDELKYRPWITDRLPLLGGIDLEKVAFGAIFAGILGALIGAFESMRARRRNKAEGKDSE